MSAPRATPVIASERTGYQIPSLGYRILMAGLRMIPSFLLLVLLPVAALLYVNARGYALPISVDAVALWGILLVAIGAAQYVLKPTAAYGPLSILYSAVGLAYLAYAITLSPYRFVLPGGTATIAAGYATFLELLLIVPALGVLSGLLTTIEDLRWPRERLPFDYPA